MCEAARVGDERAEVYDALADEAIVRVACEEAQPQGEATCAQARADEEEVERVRSEVKSASEADRQND